MPMDETLTAILDEATQIQQASAAREQTKTAAGAIRYAVLKRLEVRLDLPVFVKYGDDDAVREEYGVSNNRVWGSTAGDGWTRFQVAPDGQRDIADEDLAVIKDHFAAIGAWWLGSTGEQRVNIDPVAYHALWPNDHPVRQWLPERPEDD